MELLGSEKEVLKVTLVDVHLTLVHEVQDRHQVTEPGTDFFVVSLAINNLLNPYPITKRSPESRHLNCYLSFISVLEFIVG
jgi:hypothetical protein